MGKKHKKKIYNTPKKIKHVHKTQPMSILNSINNPKCKYCSSIMANHLDRYTCTNCEIHFEK